MKKLKADAETRRNDSGECPPPAIFAEPNLPIGMVMVPAREEIARIIRKHCEVRLREAGDVFFIDGIERAADAILSSSLQQNGSEERIRKDSQEALTRKP